MWVVAVIGSDRFSLIPDRIKPYLKGGRDDKEINLSIIGLSPDWMQSKQASHYKKACGLTKEGVFVNIVDKRKCP